MYDDGTHTTWVATIQNPVEWLRAVALEQGFTPRRDPMTMGYVEIQRAVANVLCPLRLSSACGVSVSFRKSSNWRSGLGESCLVVFYSSRPVGVEQVASSVFPTTLGVDIKPAYGSAESLRALLDNAGRWGEPIGRTIHQGLPIEADRTNR